MPQRSGYRIARAVALLAICSLGVLLTVLASDAERQHQAPAPAVVLQDETAPADSLDAGAFGEEQ